MAQDYAQGLISGQPTGSLTAGLLGGLAEGIKQGVVSYNDAKRMKMQQQAQNADIAAKGLIQDPNTGEIKSSPGLLAKQAAEYAENTPLDQQHLEQRPDYQFLTKHGYKIAPDTTTPAQLKEQFGHIVTGADAEARQKETERANRAREDLGYGRLDLAGEKGKTKASEAQNKAYTTFNKDLQSFRGNAGAQQASKDLLSADKAIELVKGKDPNSLTTQDLSLLAGELAKIAQGGIPTEHGVQALMPNNLATKAAELQNFLLSKPSDANSAAYIKKNMAYLQEMRGVAQKTLDDFRDNIAEGYKDSISEDQWQRYQNRYHPKQQEKGTTGGGGLLNAGAEPKLPAVDPEGLKKFMANNPTLSKEQATQALAARIAQKATQNAQR